MSFSVCFPSLRCAPTRAAVGSSDQKAQCKWLVHGGPRAQGLPGESFAVLAQLVIHCLGIHHFTQPFGSVALGQKAQEG